jgi:hypothetical protein
MPLRESGSGRGHQVRDNTADRVRDEF